MLYSRFHAAYKDYWEEMNLSLGLCLCLLEVDQDREVWPPEFPINKC